MMFILEPGNELLWLIIGIILLMLSPAILMTIIGLSIRKKNPKAAKVLFIISVVYILIGLGICGVLSF